MLQRTKEGRSFRSRKAAGAVLAVVPSMLMTTMSRSHYSCTADTTQANKMAPTRERERFEARPPSVGERRGRRPGESRRSSHRKTTAKPARPRNTPGKRGPLFYPSSSHEAAQSSCSSPISSTSPSSSANTTSPSAAGSTVPPPSLSPSLSAVEREGFEGEVALDRGGGCVIVPETISRSRDSLTSR